MSNEADNSTISVLLPAARVTLFSNDSETAKNFEAIADDWRFARVNLEMREGDVETAISYYAKNPAPELIVIQTESTDSSFTEKLEDLGQYCDENTAAIIIGPVNDVNLYRNLVNMGVSDYLVKPVVTDILANDIASTLIEQKGAAGSRLIAVIGAKGGVGTTVITEALARSLANDLDQKTFLLDAAGGWSTLNVGMQFEPSTTLSEATRAAAENNEDSLSRMIHKDSEKLFILSGGGDVMLDDNVSGEALENLIDYFMAQYPVVLMDLSGANAALKRVTLARAHNILLVTMPTLPALRATRSLIQEMRDLRGKKDNVGELGIILNQVGIAPKEEVSAKEAKDALEKDFIATISFEPALFIRCESEAKALAHEKGGDKIMNDIAPFIRRALSLGDAPAKSSGNETQKGLGGILGKLKGK